METHLYLVRHGQAVVNVTNTMGGMKGDTGLTEFGVRQAEQLRDFLKTHPLSADVFLASTLPRARQTATIIAPSVGVPLAFDDDLQEFRMGDAADGLSLEDYKARYGWTDFRRHPFTPTDPGGESFADFQMRVARTLNRIVTEHAGKTILCVSHGGVVDASFTYFFGLPLHQVPPVRFHTRNTAVTHWMQQSQENETFWRLGMYNDIRHLAEGA